MKVLHYVSIFLSLFLFAQCETDTGLGNLSDEAFIEYINVGTYPQIIDRIDSLAQRNEYSGHKTAILYYEKSRNLQHLEKDVEAIGSIKKAIEFFEGEDKVDKTKLANAYVILSSSETLTNQNDNALQHINRALEIFKEINDIHGVAKSLNALAHIEFQEENYAQSIIYVKRASEIQKESGERMDELAASYNNLALIIEQTGDTTQAREYYEKAIVINEENDISSTFALRNLGYSYFETNQLDKCDSLYDIALEIEQKAGRLSTQEEIYGVLLEVCEKRNDLNGSIIYSAKLDSMKTLLSNEENEKKIKLISDQYTLLAKERELIVEKNSNQKNKIILTALSGLILFFGLFLYQRNKSSKLAYSEEKLRLEQQVLRAQMNPHFIFNTLTSIQSTLFDNDPVKSSSYLSKFSRLIRQNFDLTGKEEISLKEELEVLKSYIETQQIRFENKFDYRINMDQDIDLDGYKLPPLLLQPFVENAIEHGFRDISSLGLLALTITRDDESITFQISDNGSGFDPSIKKDDKEHAIDVFKKRLQLRNKGEEHLFSISRGKDNKGTLVTIKLFIG